MFLYLLLIAKSLLKDGTLKVARLNLINEYVWVVSIVFSNRENEISRFNLRCELGAMSIRSNSDDILIIEPRFILIYMSSH